MFIKELLSFNIDSKDYEDLKRSMVSHNLKRSGILAIVVIIFEVILSLIDITTSLMKVNEHFHFSWYLFMYLLMILGSTIMLVSVKMIGNLSDRPYSYVQKVENGIIVYMMFVLLWGCVVTLIDQKLYGQAMSFMINMTICSVIYYVENKKILMVYGIPVLVLFLGLPFFQSSSNILIGHYVNLSIYIILLFVASRISFVSFCSNFKSNRLLAKEIENNRLINIKLEEANAELKELSLVDELTKISNRRSLNTYIDFEYEYNLKQDSLISIIMMDIDCFKKYNDNYGHSAGDNILILVAQQINTIVRHSSDFLARLGGDEFVFVSINTSEDEIIKIANRIRKSIIELKIPHEYSENFKYVTLSLGTATTSVNSKEDIYTCIENADKALYEAKMKGKNVAQGGSKL